MAESGAAFIPPQHGPSLGREISAIVAQVPGNLAHSRRFEPQDHLIHIKAA